MISMPMWTWVDYAIDIVTFVNVIFVNVFKMLYITVDELCMIY